jgi:hypothetical protein
VGSGWGRPPGSLSGSPLADKLLAGHQDDTSEYVVTSFAPECVAHGPTFAAQALVRLALWRTQPPREWIPPQPQPRPPWHSLRFLAHEGNVETYLAIRSRHALYSYLPHL